MGLFIKYMYPCDFLHGEMGIIMKKMIYYIFNAFICTVFLAIRFAHYLFLNEELYSYRGSLINIITFIVMVLLMINLYLGYVESKK